MASTAVVPQNLAPPTAPSAQGKKRKSSKSAQVSSPQNEEASSSASGGSAHRMEPPFKSLNAQSKPDITMVDAQSVPELVEFSDTEMDDLYGESGDEEMDQESRDRAIQERKKADEDAQKQKLTEGAEGMLQQRNSNELPDKIRKLHRQLAPLVRQWWKSGAIPASHKGSIEKIDASIKKTCSELGNSDYENALKTELVKQTEAGKLDTNDKAALDDLKKQFFEYPQSNDRGKKYTWDFFHFTGKATQPFSRRWQTYYEQYKFPSPMIEGHINSLGLGAKRVEELDRQINEMQVVDVTDSPEETVEDRKGKTKKSHEELKKDLSKAKKDLIKGALTFQEVLAQHQLESKLIIPDHYKMLFATLVNESKENKEAHKKFLEALTDPLKEQEEIWEVARPEMQQFFQLVNRKEGNISEMKTILNSLKQKNAQLAGVNSEMGLTPSNYELPVLDMHTLCQYKEKSKSNADIEKKLKQMKAYMSVWLGNAELKSLFPTIGDVQLPEKKLLQEQQKMLQITQGEDFEASPTAEDTPAISSTSASPASSPPSNRSDPNSQSNPASQSASRSSEGEETSETTVEAESLMLDDNDGTIQMMSYEDGRSEYGKLEAVRPCRTGNIRFDRFIVNAGTEKLPFYKVIKGSDLGPGGAEAFDQTEDLHTKFNIAARRQAMKQVGKSTIESLGPCCEMPRESSGRLTKAGKPYRQDLYVRVRYHTDEAKNPDAGKLPTVEWLVRSELGSLLGKKYAETKETVMVAAYIKRRAYFEGCKKAQIHPETKKPLSTKDYEMCPWLFPDDSGTFKRTGVQGADNEEYDMSGVNVDGDVDMG